MDKTFELMDCEGAGTVRIYENAVSGEPCILITPPADMRRTYITLDKMNEIVVEWLRMRSAWNKQNKRKAIA